MLFTSGTSRRSGCRPSVFSGYVGGGLGGEWLSMGQSKHAYALANTYDRTATAHRVLGVVFVVDKPQGKLARLPDGTHTHTHTHRERERETERERE